MMEYTYMYVIMWSGAGVSSGELPLGCVMLCTVSQPLAVEKWVFVFVFVFPGVPPSEFVDDCLDRRQGRRAVVLTVAEFRDHVNLVYGDLLEKVKCSGAAAHRSNPREISMSTALRWLHKLGFAVDKAVSGAVFNDGMFTSSFSRLHWWSLGNSGGQVS
jgi:hypothetical protein